MSGEREYRLSLKFDRGGDFVHGFEVGAFWAQVEESPDELVEGYLRSENIEMAMRIGDATRRKVDSAELNDGWLWVRFHSAGSLDDETLASDESFPVFSTGEEY